MSEFKTNSVIEVAVNEGWSSSSGSNSLLSIAAHCGDVFKHTAPRSQQQIVRRCDVSAADADVVQHNAGDNNVLRRLHLYKQLSLLQALNMKDVLWNIDMDNSL